MKKTLNTVAMLLVLLALAACGDDAATTAPATGGGNTAPAAGATELTVNTVENPAESKYAETALTAKAGDVKVTFNNKSPLPHNWTLVKADAAAEQKAVDEALAAGAPDYKSASALAQTKMLASAGLNETLTAKLDAGTYTYLCTFPGHYQLGMKGTLTVNP